MASGQFSRIQPYIYRILPPGEKRHSQSSLVLRLCQAGGVSLNQLAHRRIASRVLPKDIETGALNILSWNGPLSQHTYALLHLFLKNRKGYMNSKNARDTADMSKPELEVPSQEIGDEDAKYRIRARRRVYHLTIPEPPTRLFDLDTLCRPHLLLPKLPKFPDGDWTEMILTMGLNGQLISRVSHEPLDEISPCWHPRRIDVLSVKRAPRYNVRTSLVEFEGKQVVCKLSTFPWEIVYLERETLAYEHISKVTKMHWWTGT